MSRAYRQWLKFDSKTTVAEWCDWRWQMYHADAGGRMLNPFMPKHCLPGKDRVLRVPPYYAGLLTNDRGEGGILLKTVLPGDVQAAGAGELEDPLGEEKHKVASCLVHTYPDKVLFLATSRCAMYCQYCTRSRWVGPGSHDPCKQDWSEAISYIKSNSGVRDVLLSGGDPLLLEDEVLDGLLSDIRAIPHVEIIRIGTKIPAVMPQRITTNLLRVLRRHQPLWIILHVTHHAELTEEMTDACARMVDSGFPLCSQTVLLKDVNDNSLTLKHLFHGLLKIRVRPYYLFQCDAIRGIERFRVPVSRGLEIMRELHGFTSGLAIPTYMLDAPGGGGKVPLSPAYMTGREGFYLVGENYRGEKISYYDPETSGLAFP